MAKATLLIPIQVDEKSVPVSVLNASTNNRFLIFGTTLLGALTTFVGAPAWKMRALAAALSGAVVTRALHVVKSGTRFRVTVGNAEGINLAEEADLNYKSFGTFGEFVQRCLDGEITMGMTAAVQAVAGTRRITVTIPTGESGTGASGARVFENSALDTASVSEGDEASTIATSLSGLYGAGGSVHSAAAANGSITIVLNVPDTSITFIRNQDMSETFEPVMVGAVAGVAAQPANAILLDQVSGTVAFVRIDSIPSGTDSATVERDAAETTSIFE